MAKKIFHSENSLWDWVGKVPELCALSLLWFACSIPLLTIAPATIALYDAVARNLRPGEKGIFDRFFRTFRKELSRGILMSILWLAIGAVLVLGSVFTQQWAKNDSTGAAIALVYQVLSLLPLGTFFWVMALESRFVYPFGVLHKNALIFTVSYLPRTGLMLLIFILAFIACWYLLPLVLIMPATVALLHSIPIESVFEEYM